jgi:hypothetical protein
MALDGWTLAFFKFRAYRRFRSSFDVRASSRLFWATLESNREPHPYLAGEVLSWALGDARRWTPPGSSLSRSAVKTLCFTSCPPENFREFLTSVSLPAEAGDVVDEFVLHGPPPRTARQFVNVCLLAERTRPVRQAARLVSQLPGPRVELMSFLDVYKLLGPQVRAEAVGRAFAGSFGPLDDSRLLSQARARFSEDPLVCRQFSGELLCQWLQTSPDSSVAAWLGVCDHTRFSLTLSQLPEDGRLRVAALALGGLPGGAQLLVSGDPLMAPVFRTYAWGFVHERLGPGLPRDLFASLASSHPGSVREVVSAVEVALH